MLMLISDSFVLNFDGAMHFIYSYQYNTNSVEDLSDINRTQNIVYIYIYYFIIYNV